MADLRHITGGAWEGRGIGIAQPSPHNGNGPLSPLVSPQQQQGSPAAVVNGGNMSSVALPVVLAANGVPISSTGPPVSGTLPAGPQLPDGTEEVQRKLEDEQYLRAVEETRVPLEMLAHLPPFEDLAEMEERLRQENRLTFDAIFDEPTGYYSMKCFLTSDYAVDKAIFIKDVDAYKSMRFESARLKVASLLYRRFVSPEDSPDYDKGLSVFEILAASKYRAYDERSMISHASRFMSHVTAAGTTYALTSGIRDTGVLSGIGGNGVAGGGGGGGLVSQVGNSGGVSMVAAPSPHNNALPLTTTTSAAAVAAVAIITEGKDEKARLDRAGSSGMGGAPAVTSSALANGAVSSGISTPIPPMLTHGSNGGIVTPALTIATAATITTTTVATPAAAPVAVTASMAAIAAGQRATSPPPVNGGHTNSSSGATPPPGPPLLLLSTNTTITSSPTSHIPHAHPHPHHPHHNSSGNVAPPIGIFAPSGNLVSLPMTRIPPQHMQHMNTTSDFKFVVDPPSSTTSMTRPHGKSVPSGPMSTTLSAEQSRGAASRYITGGGMGDREISKAVTVISKQGGHSLSIGRTNAIGVYGQVLRAVADRVNRGEAPRDLFDQLYREVMMDLKMDAYPRFLRSEFYKRYIQTKFIELQKVTAADFTTFRVLGRGAFGAVHACRKRNSGRIYAMKCVNKRLVRAKSALDNVMEERNALAMLRSPFVTNLKYALQDDDTLYLVMDLMIGGDLKFHLINAGLFPEKRARFYAAQILLGLEHLHQNNVIYRYVLHKYPYPLLSWRTI
jgi:hypothetical protein